ncbi:Type IV inositol polyphosphate 5-phosphatase 9 [Dichanthelium oligosanthes]|uniref:Type IV inositol polyphosphate 5-phosphatase 9 n=1 Tax=Dichanthelium oligosanthes TaxID=888268 RepID=A0A1E5UJG9_9POAL|nr:Type IV inositol polyphosphate 5-phosphatase 9 [Dichanthelium oligosanthes]
MALGKSPRPAQMIWPRSAASRVLGHRFVSEFVGLENSSMKLKEGQSETVKYRVFAGTWNVGGVAPPDDVDLEDWLDTKADSYDIYVLGFQEIVPLNPRNVLGPKQRSAAMKWQQLIGDALNSRRGVRDGEDATQGAAMHQEHGVFRCVMSKQMVGIFVSVWVRSGLSRHVRHPGVSRVGAGVLGRLGNKGAVSVRFLLHDTSFCFVCCHLASGGEEGDALRRNADAADILSRTSFLKYSGGAPAPDELPKKILDHDRVVLLGDLNYRIAMDDADARQLVRARKWSMLLENDELLLELSKGRQFDGWREGHVTFAPTYKYHRNSDQFYWCADGGANAGHQKQHRAPAWCDRILWRGKGMRQLRYERCGGYRLSDHRPVRAVFQAVCEVVESKDG